MNEVTHKHIHFVMCSLFPKNMLCFSLGSFDFQETSVHISWHVRFGFLCTEFYGNVYRRRECACVPLLRVLKCMRFKNIKLIIKHWNNHYC